MDRKRYADYDLNERQNLILAASCGNSILIEAALSQEPPDTELIAAIGSAITMRRCQFQHNSGSNSDRVKEMIALEEQVAAALKSSLPGAGA